MIHLVGSATMVNAIILFLIVMAHLILRCLFLGQELTKVKISFFHNPKDFLDFTCIQSPVYRVVYKHQLTVSDCSSH